MTIINVHNACNSKTIFLDYTVGIPRNVQRALNCSGRFRPALIAGSSERLS